MSCEICGAPYKPGFVEFEASTNRKKFLCKAHSIDFYVWLSEMQEEEEKEYQFKKK
jgi:hypothetical protein